MDQKVEAQRHDGTKMFRNHSFNKIVFQSNSDRRQTEFTKTRLLSAPLPVGPLDRPPNRSASLGRHRGVQTRPSVLKIFILPNPSHQCIFLLVICVPCPRSYRIFTYATLICEYWESREWKGRGTWRSGNSLV